jgi:hypothetical protein
LFFEEKKGRKGEEKKMRKDDDDDVRTSFCLQWLVFKEGKPPNLIHQIK